MSRALVGLGIIIVAVLSAGCGGAPPAGGAGGAGSGTAVVGGASGSTEEAPAATPGESSEARTPRPTDEFGLPADELSVEQLCAALTAEELGAIIGKTVTIDPAETEWCGYDFDDGSGMFVAPFVGNDTADEFIEQVQGFGCDAKQVEGGAVLSSCGADQDEGRPSEAWFLLDGVGVQLSVEIEATEAQYLEMVRQALD